MAIFTLIIGSLGAAGFTGAVTIFGLSPFLSAVLIKAGQSVLWNAAAKALGPKAPREQVQATIAQAAGPRVRGYGRFLLGGVRALWEAKNGTLHQIVVSHHGPISEVLWFEVNGEVVTQGGGGAVTSGPAAGYLTINAIASGDGGAYAPAIAAFPSIWTSAHRLTGQATFYSQMVAPDLDKLGQVFPRQTQTAVAMVANLSPVMDPRTGLTGFSDLTGPAALDYLIDPDGYRMPLASIDLDSFAAFTTLCDQNVTLRAGGTEKRYRLGGYYTLEDAPKDVLQRILDTADAQCYMTAEGQVGIMGGQWVAPDVTIGPADILAISLTDGTDDFSDFNVLKGRFTSPDHRFQETEVSEWRNDLALVTQAERVETLSVDMCPSQSQMQRLMKAYVARKLPEYTGVLRTNLVGLKARFPQGAGRHVIRVLDTDGSEYLFEVLGHSYSVTDRVCEISVQTISNGYGWHAASEERDPPPALGDLDLPTNIVTPPSGLTVTQDVVSLSATQNAVRIIASVDDPGRFGLQLQAQYKRHAESGWQPMEAGPGDLRAYSAVLRDGTSYDVRASWLGHPGYSSTVTVTAVSNPVAPDVPTGFSSALAAGVVTLDWINGNAGFYRAKLYRAATTDFNDAVVIETITGIADQPSSASDTPGTGTWSYWISTINSSGVESAPVGPETQTI